jgi:hypothetical protein
MKREFVINRHGKDYVLYAGLLDQAHQQGLKAIKTQLVQVPSSENGQVAICLAEVTTEKGTFTGIGDAEPGNVNRMMASALIRMAETRAKARALRDAVNVGLVALEELAEPSGDGPGVAEEPPAAGPPPVVPLAQAPRTAGGEPDTPRIVAFPGTEGPGMAGVGREPTQRSAGAVGPAGHAGPDEGPRPGGPAGRPGGVRALPGRAGDAGRGEAAPLPPTQTQLETIAKLARSTGRTVSTEGLTRAAASELITRLSEERYGARRNP